MSSQQKTVEYCTFEGKLFPGSIQANYCRILVRIYGTEDIDKFLKEKNWSFDVDVKYYYKLFQSEDIYDDEMTELSSSLLSNFNIQLVEKKFNIEDISLQLEKKPGEINISTDVMFDTKAEKHACIEKHECLFLTIDINTVMMTLNFDFIDGMKTHKCKDDIKRHLIKLDYIEYGENKFVKLYDRIVGNLTDDQLYMHLRLHLFTRCKRIERRSRICYIDSHQFYDKATDVFTFNRIDDYA